jgi:hypothetical protein
MSPKVLIEAEEATSRARRAAAAFLSPAEEGLDDACFILAEVRHFALGVAEDKKIGPDEASRLLSAILGFEVRVTGIGAGYNDLQGYARLPR